MEYLDTLNAEQKKAVLAIDGPVLIVAGAGAGKTKTITHRILHLIKSGISPESILAITFTNKAAKEMRERVFALLSQEQNIQHRYYPSISTFHSLGVKIIKENAEILGLPRHFTIYDKSDSKKAIKDALTELGLEPKEHLDKIQHIISSEKSRGVTSSEYSSTGAYDFASEMTKKVWALYQKTLKNDGALDFDDLLLYTLKLLERDDIKERYQNRFQYIHIDEYQDTNKVQNTIVKILAEKHHNICVVGDTDQNIYSWRGAEIKNMLHFEKDFPRVQTFFLEQNYRSTQNILAIANEIIQKNKFRIPKKLFTNNDEGDKISLFRGRNEMDEAHYIALTSQKLIENGVAPEHIAVLYRANFQSRVLEEAFLSYGVPYQMLGTKFFERREIKDVISYIHASFNENSSSDFLRIINTPARGIGKVTIDKIKSGEEDTISSAVRAKIQSVRGMLAVFKNIILNNPLSVAMKKIIEQSGLEKMYSTGLEEDTERLENIMELVSLASRYDVIEENGVPLSYEECLERFLTDCALTSDQDSLDEKIAGVKLMTVHSSKGLEFDYVFICGLEADLFPHKGFGDKRKTGEESEEERRLFYVAITRAGKKLFLTYAETRTIFGTMQVNAPSEFLNDISDEYTQEESYGGLVHKKPLFSIDF